MLPQGEPQDAGPAAPQRLVLPRLLRRPFRTITRLDLRTPRHAGLKGALALLLATGAAGMVFGGHVTSVFANISSDAGLGISAVKISGQSETAELDVLNSLAIPSDASLAMFPVDAARQRVEQLPWVKHAEIRKLYPDTLDVEITEREAFALWRDGDKVHLIDRSGLVIGDYGDDRFSDLPLVAGKGAGARAGEIVDLIDSNPALKARIKAAVLVGERRWNLELDNGVQVLLPADDPGAGLKRIAALDARSGILSRDIAKVDVRLADRVTVELTGDGLAKRKALLLERAKARKGSPA